MLLLRLAASPLYPLLVNYFSSLPPTPHEYPCIYRYISRLPIFTVVVFPLHAPLFCALAITHLLYTRLFLLLLGPVYSVIHAGQPHMLFCSMYHLIDTSTCLFDRLSCRSVLLSLLVSMRFPPILYRDG